MFKLDVADVMLDVASIVEEDGERSAFSDNVGSNKSVCQFVFCHVVLNIHF